MKIKYSDSVYFNMDSVRIKDFFINPDALQIMYVLAEKNPDLTKDYLVTRTHLSSTTVDSLLDKMARLDAAFFNDEKKAYTLSRMGLATLYNFHKEFVEKN